MIFEKILATYLCLLTFYVHVHECFPVRVNTCFTVGLFTTEKTAPKADTAKPTGERLSKTHSFHVIHFEKVLVDLVRVEYLTKVLHQI